MCGIAGVIHRGGTPDLAALRVALDRLSHRGPDDSGIHRAGPVALGHTRLSIIDLAGGHQPLKDSRGEYALVANGEIYNHVELRAELECPGHPFLTRSDSETILHCYRQHGAEGLERLNGMFAFALWSSAERVLVLARDRLGIKPLYLCRLPDRICFASELKALFPLLPSPPEPDPAGMLQFLEIGWCGGNGTPVRGVERLAPGTALVIDEELRTREVRFWSPERIVPRAMTSAEAEEELESLLDRVLREHMRSDVPYGLFLSGGVDSGALLGALTELRGTPLKTFSVGYRGDGTGGELADARRTAEYFGSDHCELELDPAEALRALPLAVWAADDQMYDPAVLPTALMARRAGAELKVVFTGEGGDEVFAGYGRYRRSWLQRLPKRLMAWETEGYGRRSRWPGSLRRRTFGERLRSARGQGPLDPALVRAWGETPPGWSWLAKAQYADLRTELADRLLVKVDRMLMAFGLEGRVPYLDHRVVELGLALPDGLKVQGRTGKRLLKRWAGRHLPPEALGRKKTGFGVPLGALFRDPFLERLEERLVADPMIAAWFAPGAVTYLVARQRERRDAEERLIQLMQLAIWHRLFVQRPGSRPSHDEDPLDWIGPPSN